MHPILRRFYILLGGLLGSLALFPAHLLAQGTIRGQIRDKASDEPLIGATVMATEKLGTMTDMEGNYSIQLPAGTYTVKVSYVAYVGREKEVTVQDGDTLELNFRLNNATMEEVEIVADYATFRETPVAFSNINTRQIREEIGQRDISMLMNSTPGVYATEQGGGLGDSRVTIRGFDSRYVALMIDGVPLNSMEDGRVYWANWYGMDQAMSSVQVQRGLGASKLAVTSVGGTMNMITKGIESERKIMLRQELGNDNFLRSRLLVNSGQLEGGWGFTMALTAMQQDGWVEQTDARAVSWFVKFQKQFKRHSISLGGMGTYQNSGQRSFDGRLSPALVDPEFARSHGFAFPDTAPVLGRRFNANWGYVNGEALNARRNVYHKPVINLSHFWQITDRIRLSNVLYASFGNGGGTGLVSENDFYYRVLDYPPDEGPMDLQRIFDYNTEIRTQTSPNPDSTYSATELKSTNYLLLNRNSHNWYGLLSTLTFEIHQDLTFTGGLDLRNYTGISRGEVYDLLGGDYALSNADANEPKIPETNAMVREGDLIRYNDEKRISWGGLFGQFEWKIGDRWTVFLTGTVAGTGYQKLNLFGRKDLVMQDTIFRQIVGWNDTLAYNGNFHVKDQDRLDFGNDWSPWFGEEDFFDNQSEEARLPRTDWQWFPSYTVKTGANYNINDHNNVYLNTGYMSIAPLFRSTFDPFSLEVEEEVEFQRVISFEVGYGIRYPRFSGNINLYNTNWRRPPDRQPQSGDPQISYFIDQVETLHRGFEFDFQAVLFQSRPWLHRLSLEGVLSYGIWQYTSDEEALVINNDDRQIMGTVQFQLTGLDIGNVAQTQLGGKIRYEPIKNLYLSARYTYFDRHYSDYDPAEVIQNVLSDGKFPNPTLWQAPAYGLLDLFGGYKHTFFDKVVIGINFSIINLLDTVYISDAQDGDPNPNLEQHPRVQPGSRDYYDLQPQVFFGQGRRWTAGLSVEF